MSTAWVGRIWYCGVEMVVVGDAGVGEIVGEIVVECFVDRFAIAGEFAVEIGYPEIEDVRNSARSIVAD